MATVKPSFITPPLTCRVSTLRFPGNWRAVLGRENLGAPCHAVGEVVFVVVVAHRRRTSSSPAPVSARRRRDWGHAGPSLVGGASQPLLRHRSALGKESGALREGKRRAPYSLFPFQL